MNKIVKEQKEIALFISYVLTCARGLVNEPHLYGSSRFLSIMILLDALLQEPFGYKDKDVSNMVEGIEEIRLLCMTDIDGFVDAMDKKIVEFGGEILQKKNNDNQKEVFRFFLSMLENARRLVDEPLMYGPWRLLDTMVLLYKLLKEHFGFEDADLTALIKDVEELNRLSLTNKEIFVLELDACILRMVQLQY